MPLTPRISNLPAVQQAGSYGSKAETIYVSSLSPAHYTEVRFASFLSGGFSNMAVINQPERKLAKHTSVHRRKL